MLRIRVVVIFVNINFAHNSRKKGVFFANILSLSLIATIWQDKKEIETFKFPPFEIFDPVVILLPMLL